jgi:hypothetical protein
MEAAAGHPAPGRRRWARILAGIHVGVLAGFAILAWLMLVSLASGDSAWKVPNLLASVFYGPQSMRGGFGRITLAGVSLHLLQCAGAAAVFSTWMPQASYGRTLFAALLFAAALAWGANAYVWKTWYPFLPSLMPRFAVWSGFAFFGIALSFVPWFRRRLEHDFLVN